jgi:hypothetical protein
MAISSSTAAVHVSMLLVVGLGVACRSEVAEGRRYLNAKEVTDFCINRGQEPLAKTMCGELGTIDGDAVTVKMTTASNLVREARLRRSPSGMLSCRFTLTEPGIAAGTVSRHGRAYLERLAAQIHGDVAPVLELHDRGAATPTARGLLRSAPVGHSASGISEWTSRIGQPEGASVDLEVSTVGLTAKQTINVCPLDLGACDERCRETCRTLCSVIARTDTFETSHSWEDRISAQQHRLLFDALRIRKQLACREAPQPVAAACHSMANLLSDILVSLCGPRSSYGDDDDEYDLDKLAVATEVSCDGLLVDAQGHEYRGARYR